MSDGTRRVLLGLLLAAAIVPYFVGLGDSAIWDANEAFYVETPREMIERGDFVSPTFNYEPRLNKPILSYWIVGGFYRLFGISVGVQRLAIAVGAMGILAAAYFLGCLAWPAAPVRGAPRIEAGLWAAIGLAVAPRLLMFARRIFIDIYISLFMSLTLLVLRRVGALPGSPSSVPPSDVRLHRPWNADEGSRRRRRARARIRDLPSRASGAQTRRHDDDSDWSIGGARDRRPLVRRSLRTRRLDLHRLVLPWRERRSVHVRARRAGEAVRSISTSRSSSAIRSPGRSILSRRPSPRGGSGAPAEPTRDAARADAAVDLDRRDRRLLLALGGETGPVHLPDSAGGCRSGRAGSWLRQPRGPTPAAVARTTIGIAIGAARPRRRASLSGSRLRAPRTPSKVWRLPGVVGVVTGAVTIWLAWRRRIFAAAVICGAGVRRASTLVFVLQDLAKLRGVQTGPRLRRNDWAARGSIRRRRHLRSIDAEPGLLPSSPRGRAVRRRPSSSTCGVRGRRVYLVASKEDFEAVRGRSVRRSVRDRSPADVRCAAQERPGPRAAAGARSSSSNRLRACPDSRPRSTVAGPNLPTTTPAARLASRAASASEAPAASPSASAAMTVSPAPVTSDTSRASAGRSASPSGASSHMPCSPRVMSTLWQPARWTARVRRRFALRRRS